MVEEWTLFQKDDERLITVWRCDPCVITCVLRWAEKNDGFRSHTSTSSISFNTQDESDRIFLGWLSTTNQIFFLWIWSFKKKNILFLCLKKKEAERKDGINNENDLFRCFLYWTVSSVERCVFIFEVVLVVVAINCSSCPQISSSCLFCIRITTATDVHGKIPNSVITALINVGGVTSYVIFRIFKFVLDGFGVSVVEGVRADLSNGWSAVKSSGSPRIFKVVSKVDVEIDYQVHLRRNYRFEHVHRIYMFRSKLELVHCVFWQWERFVLFQLDSSHSRCLINHVHLIILLWPKRINRLFNWEINFVMKDLLRIWWMVLHWSTHKCIWHAMQVIVEQISVLNKNFLIEKVFRRKESNHIVVDENRQ